MPQWLSDYKQGDPITFADIMSGRVGFYPGSGRDGNLVTVANQAHCVHSFLHVDYMVTREEMLNSLETHGFRGYHSIGHIDWTMKDITPNGPYPFHLSDYNYRLRMNPLTYAHVDKSYCFTEILERDENMDEEWGAKRFACTLLYADAIQAFFQIFVKQYKKAPWIVLLQDHGLGGNYDSFGKGGLLDAIIKKEKVRPKFVLCAVHGTDIWDGYEKVEAGVTFGGMHYSRRTLFIDMQN